MEEAQEFSLCGKVVVTELNLRDEYYQKLAVDFIGLQSGEGLELSGEPCRNRVLIQVGLLREDNNFPWIAIVDWLRKLFPQHQSADFRSLIERGVVTTLSLGSEARLSFLELHVNFNFVGPICDSIGVERQHLLEMRDFSEQALSLEVTNGLILELNNFVTREKLAPIVIVSWLKNFNLEFCKDGDVLKAYKMLRGKIKRLKMSCRRFETRSHRRNAAMENLLQTAFELIPKKDPLLLMKKRMKKDEPIVFQKVIIKEEYDTVEIMQSERPEFTSEDGGKTLQNEQVPDQSGRELNGSSRVKESSDDRAALTLLDIAMLSVQKLSSVYGGKMPASKNISLDLLKNQYILTCKEHPSMLEFQKQLDSLGDNISLAPPAVFLNSSANFLVDVQNAIEQHIMNFENEIIPSVGNKLGRDKLPKFKNFVNMQESATSRYIHMACDILSPHTRDKKSYRKHWVAFCKEMKNPSKLVVNQSNRFSSYFEAAAGLIHHHKEVGPFFSDLLSLDNSKCPSVILESVGADAEDPVIQSLVCVLAIVHCKILGPYWQLLKSRGEYSLFSQYILSFYQKFIDWSKDPSTLLEPEESTNIFQQFPLQENVFHGVFKYCNQWHTNKELIRACLKSTIKVIAGVTEEHLKEFLPGGTFGQAPSMDLSLQLANCTFSVLMADYPFGPTYPYKKPTKRPSNKTLSSDSSQDNDLSGSSDLSSDESSSRQDKNSSLQMKKYKRGRPFEEEPVLCMDKDYIIATVSSNGGPCKSQQDVDKMMLRFDGKSRAEKKEAVRCEMLYHKMVLDNPHPQLNGPFVFTTQMVMKLKLALPRVKPSYSLVWAPKKTKPRTEPLQPRDPPAAPVEGSAT